jgi:type IV pilus assembly protein PilV
MMRHAHLHTHRRRARVSTRAGGFTLIEVLVVLLLFSVGLLGLVGLQAKAMQISTGGEDSTRASLLANEMASTMWGRNSTTVPLDDVKAWNQRLANGPAGGLPNGVGTVTVAAGVATITVSWRAPQEPDSETHRYVTQVLIPVALAPSTPAP